MAIGRHNNDLILEPMAIYLRKSREDREAEARGEGETLARHRKILLRLAREYGITPKKIFEEVVSGESIIQRPEMIELLQEVENGEWRSIMCIDLDRLGRGDMIDQGVIIETFKNSETKIITERKLYDLNDEFDEEYTEFEVYMARKELKTINRRLQRGRLQSIREGNYLGTRPPYGFLIKSERQLKRRYLIKNPDQEAPAKIALRSYLYEGIGTSKIANKLNELGYKSYTGKKWTASSILILLKNPAYAGANAWQKKRYKKSKDPKKKKIVESQAMDKWILVLNTHESYISMKEYMIIQAMLKKKYHPPYQLLNGITNPLAGLIKCDMCGASMIYRPYIKQAAHLMCYNKHCPNKSARFEYVEERIVASLNEWVKNYKQEWSNKPVAKEKSIVKTNELGLKSFKKELKSLSAQKDKLHELLEKEVYSIEMFLERSDKLAEKIKATENSIAETEKLIEESVRNENTKRNIVPKVEKLLGIYNKLSADKKNKLLKTILDHATYRKEKDQIGDNFTLNIYPLIPEHVN